MYFIEQNPNVKKKVFSFAFVCLFLSSYASALTLSQILTEIRVRIKDTSTTRQRYTDTQLTNMSNEGIRDIVNNTWVLNKSTTITLSLNTTYYTLPSDLINIQRVTYNQQNLFETSLIKQDALFANTAWENQGGSPPPQVYFQPTDNQSVIGIYPYISTYTASAGIGSIKVIYTYQDPGLVNNTDVPFNNEFRWYPYHDLIIDFVAYRVYLIEGEIDKASLYRQEYESRVQIMAGITGRRPNYIPSAGGPSNSR